MERKTGSRGLRTILETVLLDTMYDLPSMENVSKVVIDESVIVGDAKPYVLYEGKEYKKAAADWSNTPQKITSVTYSNVEVDLKTTGLIFWTMPASSQFRWIHRAKIITAPYLL